MTQKTTEGSAAAALSRAAQTRIRRTICKCSRAEARVSDGTIVCAGDEAAIIFYSDRYTHSREGSILVTDHGGPARERNLRHFADGICAPAGVAIRTRLSSQHCLEVAV